MKFIILSVFLFAKSYCDIEFNERPRNSSLELIFFTQLHTEGHVVISPFGIWTLMSGVTVGTTGKCLKQLIRALILPKDLNVFLKCNKELQDSVLKHKGNEVILTNNNFMFYDEEYTIKPRFMSIFEKEFNVSMMKLDFKNPEASDIANKLIEKVTGVNSNVHRSVDFARSHLIVTNTFSFKALWLYPFKTSDTFAESFYDGYGRKIGAVNMMYQTEKLLYAEIADLKATALDLPFGYDGKYSMLLLLPNEEVNVQEMYSNLAKISLKDISMVLEETNVNVYIPRFKISSNVVLNKPLQEMGIYNIFQANITSFRGTQCRESILISSVIHKADIEITESGIDTSDTNPMDIFSRMTLASFNANKPFVYFIIEKSTTTILLGGIYSKPSVY